MAKKYKNILFINSGSSIGQGLAGVFAEAGHHLMLHAKDENAISFARELSAKHRVKVNYTFAEILQDKDAAQIISDTENKLGSIDCIVNLLSMEYNAPIEEFPLEKWQLLIQNNLTSTFLISKAAWGKMKRQKFGRILHITSPYSIRSAEYKSAYSMCCHGISGLTKSLALEGAKFGITCNTIAPGKIRTKEVDEEISDHVLAHNITAKQAINRIILKNHPDKAFVDINNIGVCALYLLSDFGSSVNGVTMPIDGGWTI